MPYKIKNRLKKVFFLNKQFLNHRIGKYF